MHLHPSDIDFGCCDIDICSETWGLRPPHGPTKSGPVWQVVSHHSGLKLQVSLYMYVCFSAQNHRRLVVDGTTGGGGGLGSHQYIHNTPKDFK